MKKINLLILLLFVGAMFVQYGCGDDTPPPPPPKKEEPKDTIKDTTTKDPINLKFILGVKTYNVITAGTSKANYDAAENQTIIFIEGANDKDNTPIFLELKIPGKVVGSTSFPNLTVSLGEGDPSSVTYRLYQGDPNAPNKFTVTITKYGEVGDYIEGTFTGTLITNTNPTLTKNGYFKVKRGVDF